MNNIGLYSSKIFLEFFLDIIYFPLWWYSRGILGLCMDLAGFLSNKQKSLALLVWVKSYFRPMYGQFDLAGIVISLLMRTFQIIVRGIAFLFWVIIALGILAGWILLPPLVFLEIFIQL